MVEGYKTKIKIRVTEEIQRKDRVDQGQDGDTTSENNNDSDTNNREGIESNG